MIFDIKLKFIWILSCVFLSLACAPQGELSRTLHTPHKRYLHRINAAAVAPEPTDGQANHTSGLPSACQAETGKQLCIQCQSDSLVSYRCYNFTSHWNANGDCHHTSEYLKCLIKDPPFALNFAWHSSDEKFLRENFLVWQETVHRIWDDKLQGADKAESEYILKALDWLTIAMTQRLKTTEMDGEKFIEVLGLNGAEHAKRGQALVVSLQKARLEGQLTLTLLLDKMGAFYIRSHGASNLWEELRTMSLEGLEE